MNRRLLSLPLLLLIANGWTGRAAAAVDPDAALVEVIVTFQENDPFIPWQKRRPGVRQGYGVVVEKGVILTAESLLRNSTLVELRQARTGEKLQAHVTMADPQVNLALLAPADPAALDVTPMGLGTNLQKGAEVTIVQLDNTRQVQSGKASLVVTTTSELPEAPYAVLTHNLLTDLNVNRQGAIAVHEGKLVGLLIGYNRGERIGFALPACVLKRFLDDAREKPYVGVPSAGFRWKELVDPARRAFLKLNHHGQGIVVLSCVLGSGAAAAFKPNDVILAWGGRAIDNLGFYEDAEFGRMSIVLLIQQRGQCGEEVPVKIWRDGQEQTVTVKLANLRDAMALIPENVTGAPAEYLVEGGLILREVESRYLTTRGQDWATKTDPHIVNLYTTRRDSPEQPGDRVVILAAVLPDEINMGYQQFSDQIVTQVNGQPVRNLRDVFRIAQTDGAITRLRILNVGVDLVLDKSALPAANLRLARQYRIPKLSYQRPPAPGS